MQNFKKITLSWLPGYVELMQKEIIKNEQLWLEVEDRQKNILSQRHTQSIFLRTAANGDQPINEVQESVRTRFADAFPDTMNALSNLAKALNGELCRAIYVRLMPHSVVYPHIDVGAYYAIRDRYHIVIDSPGGSVLTSGDETVTMQNGEMWKFNNKLLHDSRNDSDGWRTHLIFDILPAKA